MPSNLSARGLLGCTLTDKSIRMHGATVAVESGQTWTIQVC